MRTIARARMSVPMKVVFAFMLSVVLLAAHVAPALAAGTGDDPTPTQDVLSPREAARKARLEARCDDDAPSGPTNGGEVGAQVIDGAYRYLTTPSHKQQLDHWCGPATVQILDDYWGYYASQSAIAAYMGTTADGTDFSRVDDALRHYTARSYYYYGGLTETGFYNKVEHSLYSHYYPLAADVTINAEDWPIYNYSHAGHIIPIEGFDWRYGVIRINDPYNEADYRTNGGQTYGQHNYSMGVVWKGIAAHFRHAVVCAP